MLEKTPAAPHLPDVAATVGQNVRTIRTARGLSISELARQSGVAKGTLSQLETGRGNPTLETLFLVSGALGASVGSLIAGPDRPDIRVLRAGEGTELYEGSLTARLLDRVDAGTDQLELYDLCIEPAEHRESPAHTRGVFEHLLVRSGRMLAGPAAAPVELEPGDYASYRADAPHIFAALGGQVRAVCLVHYPGVARQAVSFDGHGSP